MTTGSVTTPGSGRIVRYAGQAVRVLVEPGGGFDGFAAAEMTVPAGFAGPVPHVHHGFDEALYVLDGELLMLLGEETRPAPAGSFCLAPRGVRHSFRNPSGAPVRVLGLWSPGSNGLAFMAAVGAAIPPAGAPDPDTVAEIYRAHDSVLRP